MAVINRYDMSRSQTLRRLKSLEAGEIVFTLYVGPHDAEDAIRKELQSALDRGEMLDSLVEKAFGSSTGAAVFYAMGRGYVVRPPFPLAGDGLQRGFHPGPLRLALERDRKLGLVLVRLALCHSC
ncbi:MAG: hypothetical protein WC541_01450, partial [Dehalococcoidia bacterium]